MTRRQRIAAITIAIALTAAWFIFRGKPESASANGSAKSGNAVSALVETRPIERRKLTDTLTAFGEVTTGQVEAVSFPRAGQVTRLLVLPGQKVARNTPLAILASDPNTQLAYNQASSAVNFAKSEWQRMEELFKLQLATRSQVDAAHKTYQDALATLDAQRKLGGGVESSTVVAPFDGVVTSIAVAQGERIQPGAAILQLGHTNTLRVVLGIEPADSRRVRVGTPVTLIPMAHESEPIRATVSEIQHLVDPKVQLVNAVVVLPVSRASASSALVPGMRVRTVLETGQNEVLAVPRNAVLTDERGDYVFQVVGGTAHRVNVTEGVESADMVGISGPLDMKAPVVVVGNYELQDGMRVREAGR